MYAMALLLNLILGWDFSVSVWLSAIIVLLYISLGGLTSAIYNEVMQFFLIVAGFAPLVFLGLRDARGWSGLQMRLGEVATAQHFALGAFTHSWSFMGNAADNPMEVQWFGMLMGLGFGAFVWLLVHRFSRDPACDGGGIDWERPRRTPLVAAVPKMLFPFLVILPCMVAIALTQHQGASGFTLPSKVDGSLNYDLVIPLMLRHYFPCNPKHHFLVTGHELLRSSTSARVALRHPWRAHVAPVSGAGDIGRNFVRLECRFCLGCVHDRIRPDLFVSCAPAREETRTV
jgi:SSS family solute:Na+ symporter